MSHELRNPLAPIQAALDLLGQAEMSPAESERELSVVARQVRHLTRLVDDLLDISRINRGRIELRKELVVLGKAVAEVIEAVKPLVDQRQLELRVSLPADSIRLEADPTRLEQIFLNLLTNAVKYTNVGGRIELRAEAPVIRSWCGCRTRESGLLPPHCLGSSICLFRAMAERIDRKEGWGSG